MMADQHPIYSLSAILLGIAFISVAYADTNPDHQDPPTSGDHHHGDSDHGDHADHDDHHHSKHDHGDIDHGDDSDGHRFQSTHVHGVWELFAALDNDQLSITVTGPLVDVLGFEHVPANTEERAAVRALEDRLRTPQSMVSLSEEAKCMLAENATIILPDGFASDPATGEMSAHEDDDHKHQSAHHEGEVPTSHNVHANDFEVGYIFDCQSPANLRELTASAFGSFPKIERVDAVFLGESIQKADQLTRSSNTFRMVK